MYNNHVYAYRYMKSARFHIESADRLAMVGSRTCKLMYRLGETNMARAYGVIS